MQNTDPYLDYWRNQQKQQQAHNQYLAQQARKNLETIIQYLIQAFPIKKIISNCLYQYVNYIVFCKKKKEFHVYIYVYFG
jgi:hypothetical protein